MKRPRRLLFLVTEDWYFYSHRLLLARAAQRLGYEITVATRVRDHGRRITDEGFRVVSIGLNRGSMNIWREFLAVVELLQTYRRIQPDIVHHVAIKPILYGSIAARLSGTKRIVNALAGLGHIFTSNAGRAKWLRPLVEFAYRVVLKGTRVVVQNPDDLCLLVSRRMTNEENVRVVLGSGVDLSRFSLRPELPGMVIILPSRLLWDKGVAEFVEAARLLRADYAKARFVLVGDTDPSNPAAVPLFQLQAWSEEGFIEWWGWREDMAEVFATATIVCLPSYREGLPKALMEAAACGRPIVTCNVPGCREIVRHGDNGFLVPPRDATAVAAALRALIDDSALRTKMGTRGREMVESQFGAERINAQMLNIYEELFVCTNRTHRERAKSVK